MVDDMLHIMMKTVKRASYKGRYIALSYVWGDLTNTKPVALEHICRLPGKDPMGLEVTGVCLKQQFNITRGLATALLNLRSWTCCCWFWVDAISINQYGIDERGEQVRVMGNIYAEASFVIIWLNGVRGDIYLKAAKSMELIGDFVEKHSDGQLQTGRLVRDDVDGLLLSTGTAMDEREMKTRADHLHCDVRWVLAIFFEDLWFRRIWVLQEVCRANANAIVTGPTRHPIKFSNVMLGYYYAMLKEEEAFLHRFPLRAPRSWLRLFEHMTNPSRRLHVKVEQGRFKCEVEEPAQQSLAQEDAMDVLELFSEAIVFEATDPRDKLFAILSMARDVSGCSDEKTTHTPVLLRPDYTKSISQVFRDFTWFIIKRDQTLSFLETTRKTGRQQIVGQNAAVLAPNAFLPEHGEQEQDHPTWALWFVPRLEWTDEVGEHAFYGQAIITSHKGTGIDMTLLNDEEQPHLLPLRGLQLDEVDVVIPYVFQSHETGRAFRLDEDPPVLCACSIATIWEQILYSVQGIRGSQRDTGSIGTRSLSDMQISRLFDDFLLTIICDKFLPGEGYGLGLERNDRIRPSQDENIMAPLLAFWSIAYIDVCRCGRTALEHGSMSMSVTAQPDKNLPVELRALHSRVLEEYCAVDQDVIREDDEQQISSIPDR